MPGTIRVRRPARAGAWVSVALLGRADAVMGDGRVWVGPGEDVVDVALVWAGWFPRTGEPRLVINPDSPCEFQVACTYDTTGALCPCAMIV